MISEIKELCLKANAIILAHYYQAPEIQDIADFIGDSLDLSRKAANNDADIIVFCGVHFMAETAKILSPNKTVLLPDIDAGCSLADDCPAEEFQKFREENPDHYVVSYINCTAEVKAQSDLICTSSNAVSLVEKIPKRAGIYSALIPGSGQIYTEKYWKVPIIYAGIITSAYYIKESNSSYKLYKDAYINRLEGNNSDDIFSQYSNNELSGDHVGSYVSFINNNSNVVEARISSSFEYFKLAGPVIPGLSFNITLSPPINLSA